MKCNESFGSLPVSTSFYRSPLGDLADSGKRSLKSGKNTHFIGSERFQKPNSTRIRLPHKISTPRQPPIPPFTNILTAKNRYFGTHNPLSSRFISILGNSPCKSHKVGDNSIRSSNPSDATMRAKKAKTGRNLGSTIPIWTIRGFGRLQKPSTDSVRHPEKDQAGNAWQGFFPAAGSQ